MIAQLRWRLTGSKAKKRMEKEKKHEKASNKASDKGDTGSIFFLDWRNYFVVVLELFGIWTTFSCAVRRL